MGRGEPSGQRLVLGPALGGGVARRGLGQTVPNPALGWRPGLLNTPGQQLFVPALSSLPCSRLSRKSCLRQGSLCIAGVPSSPLPAPIRAVTTQMLPNPTRAVPVPPGNSLPHREPRGKGATRLGGSGGSEYGKGVVCRIGPAHQHPGQLDTFSLPKTHILTPRCTHRNTPQEIW